MRSQHPRSGALFVMAIALSYGDRSLLWRSPFLMAIALCYGDRPLLRRSRRLREAARGVREY
jgi:hypothetical protein